MNASDWRMSIFTVQPLSWEMATWFTDYRPATRVFRGFRIRRVRSEADWNAVNALYQARNMLPVDPDLLTARHNGGPVYWLAEDEDSGAVIGSVMGLNHHTAFHDPENGSSLWCLAVDPLCSRPGVGEVLVRHLKAAKVVSTKPDSLSVSL